MNTITPKFSLESASFTDVELAADRPDSKRTYGSVRLDRLLSYVILFCGLFTVSVGARQIISSHSLVPLWDEWQEIDAIATAPNHWPPINWLWALHNEHRIVSYRLLLLADIHLFHGNHWLYFWCMLAVQVLFLVALTWLLRFNGIGGTLWRAVMGIGAFCLFCPTQWENFGWAFQITFLLPGFLAMLSLCALLKYDRSVQHRRPRWEYLAVSIVALCVATYTSANGILVWPMSVLVAIALTLRPRVIVACTGFGLVLIGSYLYHYSGPPQTSSPLNSIRHPLQLLAYTAGYLGLILPPWVRIRDVVAVSSGACGLVIAIILALSALKRRRREPLQVALVGLMFFSVCTALLTALGRLGFGLAQGFSSRYQTFNLMFWFSVVTLLLLLANEVNAFVKTILLSAIAGGMLVAPTVFSLGQRASRTRTEQAEAAATALLAGVPDKQALSVLFLDPNLVWRDARYFHQQHLFMFSDPKNDDMGQLVSSAYRITSSQECRGETTAVERTPPEDLLIHSVGDFIRFSGWAINNRSKIPINRFIFAADGKIIGYGASLVGSFSTKHSELVRQSQSDMWLGYAVVPPGPTSVDVYGGDSDMVSVCRLSTITIRDRSHL